MFIQDYTKDAKSTLGQLEYIRRTGNAAEINRLVDSFNELRALANQRAAKFSTMSPELEALNTITLEKLPEPECPTVVAEAVAATPQPKAHQVWIDEDGIAYTVFTVRKGVVTAFCENHPYERPNGKIDGKRVHMWTGKASQFIEEFTQ